MLAAGIDRPALEELEGHLREEMKRQQTSGLDASAAFAAAIQQIGAAHEIKKEFMKMDHQNRPLLWAAWILFVASFFLIACNETWGWQCAWLSARVPLWDWQNFSHGDPGAIWLASLTLTNLLMLASPLLLAYPKIGSSKWLRWLFLSAGILVWAYIVGLMARGAFSQLKIGCYAWGLSYGLVCLSLFAVRSPKKLLDQNV